MTFQNFITDFEKQLDPDCFTILYPKNNNNNSFWIIVNGKRKCSELYHYEFIQDGNIVNLEIHFEFGTSGDYYSVIKLWNKKLLKKRIEFRYPFLAGAHQVGIMYKTFDLNSASLIKDSLKSLEKMNKKFQKYFQNYYHLY